MQRLPRSFARENGIKEAEEIILVDKNGVKWPSYVASAKQRGEFYMAHGWKRFCEANKLNTGDTFTLEFVRGEDTTPMLKFCSKAKVKVNKHLVIQVTFFCYNELYSDCKNEYSDC